MSKPATKFAPGSGISDRASREISSTEASESVELQQLRRITTYMRDLVVELDVQGRLMYVSPSAQELLGYDPAELAGHSIYPYLHPEDAASLRVPQDRTAIPLTAPFTFRVRHQSGPWVSLEGHGRIVRAPDRMVTGAIVAARDITERRLVEMALRQSERRYRDLVDNTEDFIFSLDRDCRVTAANRSICRAFGSSEEEMLGEVIHDLKVPYELVHSLERLHRKVIRDGQTAETETKLQLSGGGHSVYRFTVYPIRGDCGEITGVAGLCRDITSQIQALENIRYLTFHDKLTGSSTTARISKRKSRATTPRGPRPGHHHRRHQWSAGQRRSRPQRAPPVDQYGQRHPLRPPARGRHLPLGRRRVRDHPAPDQSRHRGSGPRPGRSSADGGR